MLSCRYALRAADAPKPRRRRHLAGPGCRWFTRTYTDGDDEFVSHGLRFLAQSCAKALMPGVPQDRRDNVPGIRSVSDG